MTVNHDVVSSSLTGAAKEKTHLEEVGFFFGFFSFLLQPDGTVVVGHAVTD